jgi:hypothetical protein
VIALIVPPSTFRTSVSATSRSSAAPSPSPVAGPTLKPAESTNCICRAGPSAPGSRPKRPVPGPDARRSDRRAARREHQKRAERWLQRSHVVATTSATRLRVYSSATGRRSRQGSVKDRPALVRRRHRSFVRVDRDHGALRRLGYRTRTELRAGGSAEPVHGREPAVSPQRIRHGLG